MEVLDGDAEEAVGGLDVETGGGFAGVPEGELDEFDGSGDVVDEPVVASVWFDRVGDDAAVDRDGQVDGVGVAEVVEAEGVGEVAADAFSDERGGVGDDVLEAAVRRHVVGRWKLVVRPY